MRSGGAAGAPDRGDLLLTVDLITGFDEELLGMRITRAGAVRMLDHHGLAVAALPAAEDDYAVGSGANRRPARRGDVHALMLAVRAIDRVAPFTEVGGDAPFQRRLPFDFGPRLRRGFRPDAGFRHIAGPRRVASAHARERRHDLFHRGAHR